jgi:hypothetical protein
MAAWQDPTAEPTSASLTESVEDIASLRRLLPLAPPLDPEVVSLLHGGAMLERGELGAEAVETGLGFMKTLLELVSATTAPARAGDKEMLLKIVPLSTEVPVTYRAMTFAPAHGAQHLASEDTATYWESKIGDHALRERAVTVVVPPGVLWSELRIRLHDFGNYSPQHVVVTAKVSGKQVAQREHKSLIQSGWCTLMEIEDIDKEIDKILAFGIELHFAVHKNHGDGINSRIACLKVMGASRLRVAHEDVSVFRPKKRLETYHVRATGSYSFVAIGAKAADGRHKRGGKGAIVEATFPLERGDVVEIVVGETSSRRNTDTGGGGGTFAWLRKKLAPSVAIPLVVAGGGGGTRGQEGDLDGQDASLEPHGHGGAGAEASRGDGGVDGRDGRDAKDPSYGRGGHGIWTVIKSKGVAVGHGGFGGGGNAGKLVRSLF